MSAAKRAYQRAIVPNGAMQVFATIVYLQALAERFNPQTIARHTVAIIAATNRGK